MLEHGLEVQDARRARKPTPDRFRDFGLMPWLREEVGANPALQAGEL